MVMNRLHLLIAWNYPHCVESQQSKYTGTFKVFTNSIQLAILNLSFIFPVSSPSILLKHRQVLNMTSHLPTHGPITSTSQFHTCPSSKRLPPQLPFISLEEISISLILELIDLWQAMAAYEAHGKPSSSPVTACPHSLMLTLEVQTGSIRTSKSLSLKMKRLRSAGGKQKCSKLNP